MLVFRLVVRKSALFVQLQIQGSRRIIYLDTLKAEASVKDSAAVQYLMKMHLRANGGHSVDTLSFQEIALPIANSLEAMKLLVATGSLYFQDVILQKGDPVLLIWKGDLISERSANVRVMIGEIPLEKASVLYPGWAIVLNRWVEIKTTVPWKWVEFFQLGPQVIEGVQKKRFLEENNGVLWNKKEAALPLQVIPRLVLSDATGSFANLFMDYEGVGTIAFEDLAPHIAGRSRLKEDEGQWEKDLLESGFQRKMVGVSRYYCPGEKARSALQLLLEVGWRCTNMHNQTVLLQSGCKLRASESSDEVILQGSVQFQNKDGSLKSVMAAAQRGRLFVDLDGSSVGLIDRTSLISLPHGPNDTWEGEAFSLPKFRLGELAALLEEKGIDWPDSLRGAIKSLEQQDGFGAVELGDAFQGTLLPYQEKGVEWLNFLQKNGFGALLSDEMGLGKTVQTLAFFSQLRTNLPILIVAPTSLIFNWQKEIAKFWPAASVTVHGGPERLTSAESLQGKSVILTSYGILRADQEIFALVSFEAVALDESQAIKSSKSLAAQAACQLKSKFRMAITGTPIENRPEELWSQFHFLMPGLLGDQASFSASSHALKRLRVKPFVLKRRKEDVQIHLPEKIDLPLWIEMTEEQQNLYDETISSLKSGLLKNVQVDGVQAHRFEILAAILRLRQICIDPRLVGGRTPGAKAERLLAMAEEWASSGQKALVFSQFSTLLRILQTDLQKMGIEPIYLDGSIPAHERGELVRKFQEEDKPHLFLLSLKAGGVGLNLTAAQNALLLEPWWNEAVEQQAIDRAHRIGQKNTLWVHRFLTPNAIEEKMVGLKERKMALTEEILEGENGGWSSDDLASLMMSL